MKIEHPIAQALVKLVEGRANDIHPVKNVSKLSHSVQLASRMSCLDWGQQWTVAGLFHDAFGAVAPHSHGEMAALALKPFLDRHILWTLANHDAYMRRFWYPGDETHLGINGDGAPLWHSNAMEFTREDWASFNTAHTTELGEIEHYFGEEINRVFAHDTGPDIW